MILASSSQHEIDPGWADKMIIIGGSNSYSTCTTVANPGWGFFYQTMSGGSSRISSRDVMLNQPWKN